ncbi:MAG TPA: hypothetical protein VKH19_07960 [Gemmatimonadaceae bacterium]|nr:hypothetical protein [Gemmatimonadaceae bacterium]
MVAIAIMAVLMCASCSGHASDAPEVPQHTPGYVVDSILPPGEAMRRFRAGLDSPAAFGGPTSRDSLVARFFAGVRRHNRAALDSLAMTRAEFAYFVFPSSRLSRPPYRQPPDIAWMLFHANSESGLTKLLNRSENYRLRSYTCAGTAEHEGTLALWRKCVVHLRDGVQPRDLHLFGTIIEVGGRFKFAGYDNDF